MDASTLAPTPRSRLSYYGTVITESSRHIDPLSYDKMALSADQPPFSQATYSTILFASQSFLAFPAPPVPGQGLLRTPSKDRFYESPNAVLLTPENWQFASAA